MPTNLFGKLFQATVLFLLLAELASFLAHFFPLLNQAAFLIIIAAVLALALYRLEYGLYVLLAELFVGGLGYLFFFDLAGFKISLRIGLFLIILLAWLIKLMPKSKSIFKKDKLTICYLLFAICLIFGLINGWRHNHPTNVFFDANAWFYFALLPVFWSALKNEKTREDILQVLIGATGYLAVKTLGTLFLFAHNFAGLGGVFYNWIRDTRAGEITYVSGTIFRVFFQSQIYCLIGFFVVLVIILAQEDKKNNFFCRLYLYLVSLAVIISQSRSFWVGGAAGLIFLLIFAWRPLGFRFKKTAILLATLAIMFGSQILLIQFLTGNFSGNLIASRFNNLETEPAGQSRLNQLSPLITAIAQKPLLGYGFGKTLTYQSSDPRVLKNNPDGKYTTYAFEWGYLDIALKLGLIGLGIYLVLLVLTFYRGLNSKFSVKGGPASGEQNSKSQIPNSPSKADPPLANKPLNIGFLLGLIALIATNVFSPYLNHPLGIGYILLCLAIFKNQQ